MPTLLLLGSLLAVAPGCARRSVPANLPILSARATYERGLRLIDKHNLFQAISTLQLVDLRYSQEERQELEPLVKLAIADATFYQDNTIALIDASTLYDEFVTLYVDHPMAPYAQFQIGMCALKQVNQPTKDQTQTHAAIAALSRVQRNYPSSAYARAGRDMVESAHTNLAEHEYRIGRFYMKRKKYTAAIRRFERVLDSYPDYSRKDRLFFQLGRSLLAENNDVEAKLFFDKLLADYPEGKYAEEARKVLVAVGGLELGLEASAATD